MKKWVVGISACLLACASADAGAAASGAPVASAFNRALLKRLDWSVAIMDAWKSKDAAKIKAAAAILDEAEAAMRDFYSLYRDNWNATSRPFGFELIQKRNAGVLARFEEAKRRVHDYLDGKAATIPELDEAVEPFGQPAPKRTISW